MLLFGTVIGWRWPTPTTSSITNAAREGARYGAAADAAALDAGRASVQTRVQQVYFNAAGAAPTDDQVCVKLVQADGTVVRVGHSGSACGTEPALPDEHGHRGPVQCSCGWRSRHGIRLAVVPDLHSTLKAQSVSYYGRTVGTTCTAD